MEDHRAIGIQPATDERDGAGSAAATKVATTEVATLSSEFASVRVSVDSKANGPRLLVEDLEGKARIFLDPLELASLCHASESDRRRWLLVGPYRDERS